MPSSTTSPPTLPREPECRDGDEDQFIFNANGNKRINCEGVTKQIERGISKFEPSDHMYTLAYIKYCESINWSSVAAHCCGTCAYYKEILYGQSKAPTIVPTASPTVSPTAFLTASHTDSPTSSPNDFLTASPTDSLTASPTEKYTNPPQTPTLSPTSETTFEFKFLSTPVPSASATSSASSALPTSITTRLFLSGFLFASYPIVLFYFS
mmetsp:Transcript_18768/g.39070  ORF Transcript_18768/g.39070 Transcript_18768/m.39070 type:complete len:210 (-) Transcript_18768:17-646(-)